MSTGVNATARWLDSFFEDQNYVAEEADSRLEIGQSAAISERAATAYRTRIRGRLSLPNLSRRFSLEFSGNSEPELVDYDTSDTEFAEAADEAVEDPAIGISWIQASFRRMHLRLSGGARLENPSLYVGPRLRYLFMDREDWLGRFSQRVRWDSADGWESSSRIDLDFSGSYSRLWRQSFGVDWQEQDGTRGTATSTLFQSVSRRSVVRSSVRSVYQTKPNQTWDSHQLTLSLRRALYRDWIVAEVSPFLAFEDRFDWKPNPGIEIRLDLVFEQDRLTPKPAAEPGCAR